MYRVHAICPMCRKHVAYHIPEWVVNLYGGVEPDRFAGTYQCPRTSCRQLGRDGVMRRTLIDLYAVSFQHAQPVDPPGRREAA